MGLKIPNLTRAIFDFVSSAIFSEMFDK